MALIIKPKRSGTAGSAPTTSNLADGELAVNSADQKIFIRSSSSIVTLGVGTTSTATELNIMDGDTSATSTTLADADRVVVNDAGTMKQVALSDFETYFESGLDTLSSVTTVGALNSGSITSGFGTIDTGSSTITTTGLISGGSLDIDDVLINGTTIGHTDDSDLITVADGKVTVAGELQATTLDIGGTNITSTAAELNLLDGVSGLVQADLTKLAAVDATAAEINLIDGGTSRGTTAVASGDGILINDAGIMRMTNVDTVSTYFASHGVGGGNIVTTGALNSGSITSGFGTIDTGSSTITTTGLISGGSLDIDDVLINGTTIGHTDDSDLMTVADGVLTVAGEVDAVSLDVSGNADIDGTLEADAYTVNGTTLAEYIADTAGAMVGGNTETGITVTYQDGDNTIDFAIDAAQSGITSVGTLTSLALSGNITLADDTSIGISDSDERIEFDGAGDISVLGANFGIGRAPVGTQSAWTSLTVGGTGTLFSTTAAAASNQLVLSQNAHRDTDDSWEYIVTDEASQIQTLHGKWYFNVAGSGTAGNDITWTSAMVIDNSGHVGIGDTSPSAMLNVTQASAGVRIAEFEGGASNNESTFVIKQLNTSFSDTCLYVQAHRSSSSFGLCNMTYNNSGTSASAFYVRGDGKVGIGTSAPIRKMEVVDAANGAASLGIRCSVTPSVSGASYGGTLYLGLHQNSNTGSGGLPNFADDLLGSIYFIGQGTDYGYVGGSIRVIATVDEGGRSEQAADMVFSTIPAGSVSDIERMRITGAGNVGIGTTSPSTLLTVAGEISVTTLDIGGTNVTSTAAELNLLDISTASGASSSTFLRGDGSWQAPAGGGGITYASQWRITAHATGDNAPLSSNWEEVDAPAGFGVLGSSMTESSGIFTFPATGYWLIIGSGYFKGDDMTSAYNALHIMTSEGGGSYNMAATQWTQHVSAASAHNSTTPTHIFDVTDTSNDTVRFDTQVGNASIISAGSSTVMYTGVTFIRLGDT